MIMNLKSNKKDSLHFTIDKKINEELTNYIKINCINRSSLIENLIENFLKTKKSD
jgi:metal-responsive CopG/Arc/MetJ family transcriptional regulator